MTKPFTKTQLFLALIVLIILSAIPLIIYTYFFSSHHRSFDPANWGTFGDFIGGTTNVILGVINIVITAYIAYLIKTLDDKRYEDQKKIDENRFNEQKILDELKHQQNLELQRNLFIKNIKYERYETYNKLHLNIVEIITHEFDLFIISEKVTNSNLRILLFLKSNQYLFPFITDSLKKHKFLFQKVIKLYTNEYNNITKGGNNSDLLRNSDTQELLKFLEIINNKIVESLKD